MSSFRSATSCIVALAIASSGCSFLFVTPPPAQYKQAVARPEADCSTSVAAPVVDGVIAGYQMFRTGYAIQASDSHYRDVPISRGADMAIGIGMTALFLASSIYGGVNVSACKRLKNGPTEDEGPGGESDRSNGWRINKDAPEAWDTSPSAARPNTAPTAAPAPARVVPPTAAPSDVAPAPAVAAPALAPTPAAPPPAAAPSPSTVPAAPTNAAFPEP